MHLKDINPRENEQGITGRLSTEEREKRETNGTPQYALKEERRWDWTAWTWKAELSLRWAQGA